MTRTWRDLTIVSTNVRPDLDAALQQGQGVLRLAKPAWVHREFCNPGKNLRLHNQDWFVLGPKKGIDERWFASTMPAKNTFHVDHEGLSFALAPSGNLFSLADAVKECGDYLVGPVMWAAHKHWAVYSKFFDNENALPWHSHMANKDAAAVGLLGKPESYYFPPEYNQHRPTEAITFMGLRPGTTKADVRRSLELWGRQGNDIRHLSKGYLMQPGTGWLMPPGVGHAPAGLCTFEPQSRSDTFQMYQARTTDGWLDQDVLLFKDIPAAKKGDLDYMVDLLDWDVNLDPNFASKYHLQPVIDDRHSGDGVTRKWVVYGTIGGKELFTATETTVAPGCEYVIQEPGASGVFFTAGYGSIGPHAVEVPSLLRFYDMVSDEYFVPHVVARSGTVKIVNESDEMDLVFLQVYGPETWGVENMPKAGA